MCDGCKRLKRLERAIEDKIAVVDGFIKTLRGDTEYCKRAARRLERRIGADDRRYDDALREIRAEVDAFRRYVAVLRSKLAYVSSITTDDGELIDSPEPILPVVPAAVATPRSDDDGFERFQLIDNTE